MVHAHQSYVPVSQAHTSIYRTARLLRLRAGLSLYCWGRPGIKSFAQIVTDPVHTPNNPLMAKYADSFTTVPSQAARDRDTAGSSQGRSHPARLLVTLALGAMLCGPIACSPSRSPSLSPSTGGSQESAAEAGHSTASHLNAQAAPPLLLDDAPVGSGDLWQALAESAGGSALQEYILDQALEARCALEGIAVTSDDIQAELELIWDSLDADRDIGARLLEQLKARRGLGPTRFPAMLRRNAMLRAVVRDDVAITEDGLQTLYLQQYGKRSMLRIITCTSRSDAVALLTRARAGESLADLALLHSTDADSAANSGLIGPVSVADSAYPMAIRQILDDLKPGEPSPVLQLESSYAIVGLVHVLHPEPVEFEAVRDELSRLARRRQERLLMESLARQLVAECDINIMDPSLGWSWRVYRNAQGER
ncbi:MAG: peptidyl-prolyl cis-trans isomerase [Planctomycetes bacterium]|nr:peptidyl-prolyl cis-trans isomerase [Planctomycetota bacterium]